MLHTPSCYSFSQRCNSSYLNCITSQVWIVSCRCSALCSVEKKSWIDTSVIILFLATALLNKYENSSFFLIITRQNSENMLKGQHAVYLFSLHGHENISVVIYHFVKQWMIDSMSMSKNRGLQQLIYVIDLKLRGWI